jgi:hypothetical protein
MIPHAVVNSDTLQGDVTHLEKNMAALLTLGLG